MVTYNVYSSYKVNCVMVIGATSNLKSFLGYD